MILSTTTGTIGNRYGYAKAIEMYGKAGYDAYDINLCSLHAQPESRILSEDYRTYAAELNAVAKQYGITCNQAHAPFPCAYVDTPIYNQKLFDICVRAMEFSSLLGAKIIVFHPIKEWGRYLADSNEQGRVIVDRNELVQYNIDYFKQYEPYCKKFGIKIAIENMWRHEKPGGDLVLYSACSFASEHKAVVDGLNPEYFCACLDVGHSALTGDKPQNIIRLLGNRIGALHIHDNDTKNDQHTIPYLGKLDWSAILKALADTEYAGDFTYEADTFLSKFSEGMLQEAVNFMQKLGRSMLDEYETYK